VARPRRPGRYLLHRPAAGRADRQARQRPAGLGAERLLGAGRKLPAGSSLRHQHNSVIVEDFDRAAERSWRIGAAFDLSRFGLAGVSGFVNYVAGDTPDSGPSASPDKDELDLTMDWKPKGGRLQGLWLRARVASINAAGVGAVDQMGYRLILNYDFSTRW
jgi:hypothetical protein